MAFVMKLRSGVTGGHTLPAVLVYLHRRCGRLVAWIRLSYCEFPVFLNSIWDFNV